MRFVTEAVSNLKRVERTSNCEISFHCNIGMEVKRGEKFISLHRVFNEFASHMPISHIAIIPIVYFILHIILSACLISVFPLLSSSNFCVLCIRSKLSQPATAGQVVASKMPGLEIVSYSSINSRRIRTS